jgi:hypothetical protein
MSDLEQTQTIPATTDQAFPPATVDASGTDASGTGDVQGDQAPADQAAPTAPTDAEASAKLLADVQAALNEARAAIAADLEAFKTELVNEVGPIFNRLDSIEQKFANAPTVVNNAPVESAPNDALELITSRITRIEAKLRHM